MIAFPTDEWIKDLSRRLNEGPQDYGRRVVRRWPALARRVEPIVRRYIDIRYGRMDSRENRRRLIRMVRTFRP